jgi:hypothetical protein
MRRLGRAYTRRFMKRLLHRVALVLLLGWLPLQTSALPLLALLCEQDPAGMHGGTVHGHQAHHGDHSGHAHHGDGGDDGTLPGSPHTCCHNLSSAALPALSATSDVPAAGVEPTPLFHPSSFFPEQPLPPPLAA